MENKRSILTREYIKIAGTIAVLAPPLSFVFSFFYDWGFLSQLGFSFSEAPTSITDHIRTGLVWLPTVIIFIVILFAVEIRQILIEAGRTEEEINDSYPNSFKSKLLRDSIPYICIILGGLAGGLAITLLDRSISLSPYFGFTVCWLVFATWVVRHPNLPKCFSRLSKLIFLFWPLIPVIFLELGQGDAKYRLESTPYNHRIHLSYNTTSSVMDTTIIRAFGDWLLVRGKKGQVEWIKMDKVYRIEVLVEENPSSVPR